MRLHHRQQWIPGAVLAIVMLLLQPCAIGSLAQTAATPSSSDLEQVRQLEAARIQTINKVAPAVVSIFGLERQGGGSGVLIHPSGLALTNHHVVAGCGVQGWGGLDDGKLYSWRLVGNDPGGDLALIQLTGRDQFPFVALGDSDQVQVGDWTLVMGNPFTLADDYTPTVTHGIVSGIHRYQPGMADLLLVYGDCIQTDTSINPGNSGGPLFNMQGELLGINGRASFDFKTRGRVNVGLGYAISVNQCRKFLPELLATKLVQHGTLDAIFQDRDGKVVCAAIFEDSAVGQLGMNLGDELLEFEETPISSANQFTNLLCTLPADWPAHLKLRREDGSEFEIRTRLVGLPYPKSRKQAIDPQPVPENPEPGAPKPPPEDSDSPSEVPLAPATKEPQNLEERIAQSRAELEQFLQHAPGQIQFPEVNQTQTQWLLQRWKDSLPQRNSDQPKEENDSEVSAWQIREQVVLANGERRELQVHYRSDGKAAAIALTTPQAKPAEDAKQQAWQVAWRFSAEQWQKGTWTNDRWEWENADSQDVIEHTLGLQLWLSQQWLPGNATNYQIDAADKVQQQLAIRLQAFQGKSPYYVWLPMDDWAQDPQVPLIRSAADPDGRYSLGATHYQKWDWSPLGPWPTRRQIVQGLFQDPVATIETVEWTPLSDSPLLPSSDLKEQP